MSDHDIEALPAAVLAHCRQRIDRIDGVLLALLRERLLAAIEAAEAKAALGEPVQVPAREAEVLSRVTALANAPLEVGAVLRIFRRIIHETRRAEERLLRDHADACPGRPGGERAM